MNYSKIYENLILDAKLNPKFESYKELHHIVPKCLGGDDSIHNLIHLTARQHYLAHWLLYKTHRTASLVHAWHSMSRIGKGQEERNVNSHLFEYCKKERSRMLSKQYSGKGNHFFGKHHTEETKRRLSEKHSGKVYKTQEQIRDWVDNVAKRKKTDDHKRKIGRKGFTMLQHTETKEFVRVSLSDPRCGDVNWVNPRKLKPEAKYKCVYCDVVTTASNLKRWHNENCKRKLDHEN
jgi:hypothetical protein